MAASRVSLLDVNVLVALFFPDHVHHELAHDWFADHREQGWATCPLTENGLVRVACGGSAVELEVWSIPHEGLGAFAGVLAAVVEEPHVVVLLLDRPHDRLDERVELGQQVGDVRRDVEVHAAVSRRAAAC